MARGWTGSGPEFELGWGGQSWTLRLDGTRPGLYEPSGRVGPLLALEGLAEAGRSAPGAMSGCTLVGFERRFEHVTATYAPLGWGAAWICATWSPAGEDGIDLLVEVSARTVGELHALEVMVASRLAPPGEEPERLMRWVEPRDAACAAMSYDGREGGLQRLTTLPPRRSAFLAPRLVASPLAPGWLFAEMAHPDDLSRRIREGGRTLASALSTRYALFGYDLEKGVVLRGRLSALWLPEKDGKTAAYEAFDRFLQEPLPLTT